MLVVPAAAEPVGNLLQREPIAPMEHEGGVGPWRVLVQRMPELLEALLELDLLGQLPDKRFAHIAFGLHSLALLIFLLFLLSLLCINVDGKK